MVTRPTDKPLFASTASGTDIQKPDTSHQTAGWAFEERPPYEYLNWLMRSYHDWHNYLDAVSCEACQGLATARLSNSVFVGTGRARGIGGNQDAIVVAPIGIEKTTGQWVAGSGNGGVPSTIHPLTGDAWYHYFIIKRDSDGAVDAGFDDDNSATHLLADSGYDQYRRVCSVYYDAGGGSPFFRPFKHYPNQDYFSYEFTQEAVQVFLSSSMAAGPRYVDISLGVPPDLEIAVLAAFRASGSTTSWEIGILDGCNEAVGTFNEHGRALRGAAGASDWETYRVTTDVSGRIVAEVRPPTTPPANLEIHVCGYFDSRHIETWI